jgi:hypothetical protein
VLGATTRKPETAQKQWRRYEAKEKILGERSLEEGQGEHRQQREKREQGENSEQGEKSEQEENSEQGEQGERSEC